MCLQRHIAMVVVGFPATALLMSRCRVCISASHSREDLDYALEVRGWGTGFVFIFKASLLVLGLG
jgi:7-keto-8-aminopelargonate synthetase-like enzyme